MMRLAIDDAVREKFELSVGIATIRGVRKKERERGGISNEIAEVEAETKRSFRIDEVKDVRTIRLQRDFFWHMGVDPTKVRPASEALLRRILSNKRLPRVSTIVNAYNLASVKTLLTFSAFDLAKVALPLVVRFSRGGWKVILIWVRKQLLTG